MSVNAAEQTRHVRVAINGRQWRGLEFEAALLSQVFGRPMSPEGVVQARIDRFLKSREAEVR